MRALAKWYISRSLDSGKALPGWVDRQLKHDAALQQFLHQSQQLAARLQASDSLRPTNDHANRPIVSSKSVTNSRSVVIASLALAALLFLMFSPLFNPREPLREVEPELAAQATGSEALSLAELEKLATSGSKLINLANDRATRLVNPLATQLRDAEHLAEELQLSPIQVMAPIHSVGSQYGELLSQVDQQIADDNRRLLSEGISAWRSFLREAPRSAATFVSWP